MYNYFNGITCIVIRDISTIWSGNEMSDNIVNVSWDLCMLLIKGSYHSLTMNFEIKEIHVHVIYVYFTESSAGRRVEKDINVKSQHSLDYLYDRAQYWKEQPPVEQRGTYRSPRSDPNTQRQGSPRKRSPSAHRNN